MKKSFVFYLKGTLVAIGFLLLLISGSLSIVEKTIFPSSNFLPSRTNITIQSIGFQDYLWYVIFLASLIVFFLGYFRNRTVNVVLVFVFIPVLGVAILFFSVLRIFNLSFGQPRIELELDYGYSIAISGAILVAIATSISVLRKKKTKHESKDLLDDLA